MKIPRLTDTGEWNARRYLSLLGSVLIWVIVAIDAWYLWPTQLGGDTSIVVVSGSSMEPTYFGGDLVIARKMDPSIGDVIVYAPKGLGGSQVVHRIIGGSADEGWQMQGDNNNFVDPFTPKGEEVKGVVLVHYSNFGRVTVLLLNPMVWAFVLLAAMVLMLWWTGDECETDEDDGGDDDSQKGDKGPEPEEDEELDLIDRVVEGTEAAVARMIASTSRRGSAVLERLTHRAPAPRHATLVPRHATTGGRLASAAYLRAVAVVTVLGLVAIFGPSTAFASQLQVTTGPAASADLLSPCANLTLAASAAVNANGNQFSSVKVDGLDPACAGMAMTVYLHHSNGGVIRTASGVVGAASTTLPASGTYNANQVSNVVVKINGWLFEATWQVPGPPPLPPVGTCDGVLTSTGQVITGVACTLNVTTQSVSYGGFIWFYLQVSATTTFNPGGYPLPGGGWVQVQDITLWRYTVDLEALPSAGWMGNLDDGFYLYKNGNNTILATGEDCADAHSITFQEEFAGGNPSSNFIVSPQPISWMSASSLLCEGP